MTATVDCRRARRAPALSRGVSLIEAMVALAVMAFGMLSLVGVQATLRLNNDLAKQRTEATLIATEEIEGLRNYSSLLPATNRVAWSAIDNLTVAAYTPPESIGNTSYRVERSVTTIAASRQKIIKVEVSWPDRTGITQRVTLDAVIWGAAPELSSLLAVPTTPTATNQINRRHVSIPASAQDVDGGMSRFVPPGSSAVAWMFNSATGVLNVCDANGTSNCLRARLVSGTVRFHRPTAAGAITAAHAENPQGPALNLADGPNALGLVFPAHVTDITRACYADSYNAGQLDIAAVPLVTGVKYYCAIFSGTTLGWGGQLNPRLVDSSNTLIVPSLVASGLQVCRYTMAATDYTNNIDHPKTYCLVASNTLSTDEQCLTTRVTSNLINQNFLVIPGDRTCPTDVAVNLASGDLVNSNTLPHQP